MRIFCMKCGEILTDVPVNIYTGNPYCPICKGENLEIEELPEVPLREVK